MSARSETNLFWLVVAIAVGLYVIMIGWSLPRLFAGAQNLPPFDLRPRGYGYADAKAYLVVLGPKNIAFYVGVQLKLDMAFPLFQTLATAWAIYRLTPASWSIWRHGLAATTLPGMIFDYQENWQIGNMLAIGADALPRDLVAQASMASQLKAVFVTIATSILMILIIRWVIARYKTIRQ